MIEEIAGEVTPATDATAAAVDTAASEAALSSPQTDAADQPQERNWEAEAREMGWIPEEEFKGDKRPAKFLSAQAFVERGETVLPFVQRENKRLKDELSKLDKTYGERFDRLSKMAEKTLAAQRAQYEERLAALQAQREKAVADGDVTAFRAAEKKIADHQANAPEDTQPEAASQDDPRATAVKQEAEWADKNKDWYGKDAAMTGYAVWFSQQNARPDLSMEENLRLTEEAVRKQFPMYFGKNGTGVNGHAPVDSGGDPKSPSARTPNFDKLSAEAKAMAKSDVAKGVYKNVEEWAVAYFS